MSRGDVQVVLNLHPSGVAEFGTWLFRQAKTGSLADDIATQFQEQGHGKRLVVIDPEDREQVARLHEAMGWPYSSNESAAAMLRSLIEPPRPEEPTGLGAVVEDEKGRRWVRYEESESAWASTGRGVTRWDSIAAVRVLSEGVTA